MTPLDLTKTRPRGVREPMLGYHFLARTIDKLRAELPGGEIGPFLNHDTGFSAYVIRRMGLDMNELRDVVARAPDEASVAEWIAQRVDLNGAQALNAKLETFVVERMSDEDQALVRQRHPIMAQRPDLTKLLDILEADDDDLFLSSSKDR
jgi:hypothetical protein